jgi:hypothetical protein
MKSVEWRPKVNPIATLVGRSRWTQSILLFVSVFGLHAPLLGPLLQNGDSAVYNEQIERRNLAIRTPHVGYLLAGVAFDAALPFATDTNLNVMSLAFGAVGLVALYWIAIQILGHRKWALLAVLAGLNYPYVKGMVLSEVDTVMCSLVLTGLACSLRQRSLSAGILFGFAMLVSPLASLWLPLVLLPLLTRSNQGSGRGGPIGQLVVFSVASVCLYLPFVWYHWQDYLYGARGLLAVHREPFNALQQFQSALHFLWRRGRWMWLAAMLGLVFHLGTKQASGNKLFAVSLLASAGLAAVFGQRFHDVPVQMPFLTLAAIYMMGLLRISTPRSHLVKVIVLVVLAISLFSSYRKTLKLVHARELSHDLYSEVRSSSAPLEPVLIGVRDPWTDKKCFGRIAFGRTSLDRAFTTEEFTKRPMADILRDSQKCLLWLLPEVDDSSIVPLEARFRVEERPLSSGPLRVLVPKD